MGKEENSTSGWGGGALCSFAWDSILPLMGFRSLEFDMASLHPSITWWVVDDELLQFA
jgi:hypothetical protein